MLRIPVAGQPLYRKLDVETTSACATAGDCFFAGPENHLIEAAVRWAIEGRSDAMTNGEVPHCPILFYGPPGCGKSHLAGGIYTSWRQNNPRKRGAFLTGDDFARSLADALEAKTIDEFHKRIRKSDLLVIDGIDLLATKKAAQEELLTSIDAVVAAGQTIVLTTQRFPTQQQFPDERLVARLTAGLVVPIALPGLTTRMELLNHFAEQLGLRLTTPANQAMAKELPVSVPQLFGTLMQLLVESGRETIDLATAREAIRHHTMATMSTIDKIAKTTARQLGLKLAELKSKSRKSTTVRARNIAIYLIRQLTHTGLKDIGRYFGGRDHTTISHGATKIESKIGRDSELRSLVMQIRDTLHSGLYSY